MAENNYREQMFNDLVQVIENTGKGDDSYDDLQKARDILEILELILANSILATSINKETIRESCEESYINIRRIALSIYQDRKNNKQEINDKSENLKKQDPISTSIKPIQRSDDVNKLALQLGKVNKKI